MGNGATKPEMPIAALSSDATLNGMHFENQADMQHMTKLENIPVIDENLEYPDIPQQIFEKIPDNPSSNSISKINPLGYRSSPLRASAANSIPSESSTDFFESSKKEPKQIIEQLDFPPNSTQTPAKTAEEYVIDDALQRSTQESKENIPDNAFSLHTMKSDRKFERSNILEISSLAHSAYSSMPEDPLAAYAPIQEFASTGSANFNFDLIDESKKSSDLTKEQKIRNVHDVSQLIEELDL